MAFGRKHWHAARHPLLEVRGSGGTMKCMATACRAPRRAEGVKGRIDRSSGLDSGPIRFLGTSDPSYGPLLKKRGGGSFYGGIDQRVGGYELDVIQTHWLTASSRPSRVTSFGNPW